MKLFQASQRPSVTLLLHAETTARETLAISYCFKAPQWKPGDLGNSIPQEDGTQEKNMPELYHWKTEVWLKESWALETASVASGSVTVKFAVISTEC